MTDKRAGFTLVELMLAMAFIAFLLLFVVSAILQITKLYTKGLAIRQINQTGSQVIESLSRSIRSEDPVYVSAANRLCVGGTSYVWNAEGSVVNRFTAPDAATPLRLISLQDPSGNVCRTISDIAKAGTRDLVGPEVTPLSLSVVQSGKLWDIVLLLSSSGSNVATLDVASPTGYSCAGSNSFCALGDFKTSVYSRGR